MKQKGLSGPRRLVERLPQRPRHVVERRLSQRLPRPSERLPQRPRHVVERRLSQRLPRPPGRAATP